MVSNDKFVADFNQTDQNAEDLTLKNADQEAKLIEMIETLRFLRGYRYFKKFKLLLIDPALKATYRQFKARSTDDLADLKWFQGHISALEKYFDLDTLIAFNEAQLLNLKGRPKNNKEQDESENHDEQI